MDNDVVCCFKNYPNITFVDIYHYLGRIFRYKFVLCADCSNLNNFQKMKCVGNNLPTNLFSILIIIPSMKINILVLEKSTPPS